MNVFDIFAKLSLDSSEYEEGLNESEKSASSFGSKLKGGLQKAGKIAMGAVAAVGTAAVATGAALIKGAGNVAAYGDNIDKMSQKLGLSATAYQEWDYVLGQAGADIQSMSTGLKTLTNKLDDAKTGSKDAQEMFAKLGLSMEDLNSMSREDVFEQVIFGFQGMADSTERAALANDLFGKSGQELTPLFNSSIEDTKALISASHELGMVMGDEAVKASADYQDALDTMQRTFGGVKRSLLSNFLPSITTVMEGLTDIFAGNGSGGVKKLTDGISSVIKTIKQTAPQFLAAGGQIIKSLYQAFMDNLPQIVQGGTELIVSLIVGITQSLPTLIPAIVQAVAVIIQTLWANFPQLIEAGRQAVVSLTQGMEVDELLAKAEELLGQFIDKAMEFLPNLLESGMKFVANMAQGVSNNMPKIIQSITNVLTKLISTIMSNLPKFLQKGVEIIGQMISGIAQNLPSIISSMTSLLVNLVATIASNLPQFLQKGIELVGKMAAGLVSAIPTILSSLGGMLTDMWNKVTSIDWKTLGSNIIDGIKNGIVNAASRLASAALEAVKNAFNGMKKWLNVQSPSKRARDVLGKNWALGISQGFVETMPDAEDDMIGAVDDAFDAMSGAATTDIISTTDRSTTGSIDGQLYAVLGEILDSLREMVGTGVYLDGKTLVGELVPAIDTAMGTTVTYKGRGVI